MEYNYNKQSLKNLYPTKQEINKAISKVESELYTARGYNTKDSKEKVKRLVAFLEVLKNIEHEK